MNKEALAAKTLLKGLAAGLGVAGVGAGAGVVGYRSGAKRTANAMASAFSEANARENRAMMNAFALANKKENAILTNTALRRGYQLGLQHATASGMAKKSSDSHEQGFIDEMAKLGYDLAELEKIGFNAKALMSMGRRAAKSIGKSFKALPGLGRSAMRTGKTAVGAGKRLATGKAVSATMAKRMGQNVRGLRGHLGRSGAALGTMAGVGGAGYLATR